MVTEIGEKRDALEFEEALGVDITGTRIIIGAAAVKIGLGRKRRIIISVRIVFVLVVHRIIAARIARQRSAERILVHSSIHHFICWFGQGSHGH